MLWRRAGHKALAWACLVVTEGAAASTAFALIGSGLPWRFLLTGYAVTNAWLGAAFAPLGALLALRRPKLPLGWFVSAFALLYAVSAAMIALPLWQATSGGPNEWTSVVGWLGISVWTPAVAVFFPLIVLLFPDGRLVSRRIRWLAGVAAADGFGWCVVWTLNTSRPHTVPFISDPPIHLTGTPSRVIGDLARYASSVPNWTAVACVAVLAVRWWRAEGKTRTQLSWLLAGSLVAIALFAPTGADVDTVWSTALLIGVPVLPVAAAVAVLRHQLLDLDVVINRTLVYLGLTVVLLGAFLGVVELVTLLVGHGAGLGGTIPAAAVVALAFSPVRQVVQQGVDVLLWGHRRDPVRALRDVSRHLGSADDELGASLAAIRDSLRLPDLALIADGRRIGPDLADGPPPTAVPLRFGPQQVGQLLVRPRRGQTTLSAGDLAALELLGVPLAAAVHSLGLRDHLQHARQGLVDAQARERTRLHRDLHDGLGPALTAIALRADAAGNLALPRPEQARDLIREAAEQTRLAIEEVRRIAHDVGPATVEHLGLLEAVRRHAGACTSRLDGGTLVVETDLPDTLPPVTAEVERAAFLIATEALTNVARHADATVATVRISAGPTLVVEVTDNGAGHHGDWAEGFGLDSMRQRARDAGGGLEAGPTGEGGRVRLTLPLGSPAVAP